MKRRTVRSITAFITALCLLTAGLTAGAAYEAPSVQPRYAGILDLKPGLTISSSGRANCTATVKLDSGYTANVTMKLESSTNQYIWNEENSWSTSGSETISMNKTYFVSHGYYYRVVVTANVYANGKLVESPSKSTASVKY